MFGWFFELKIYLNLNSTWSVSPSVCKDCFRRRWWFEGFPAWSDRGECQTPGHRMSSSTGSVCPGKCLQSTYMQRHAWHAASQQRVSKGSAKSPFEKQIWLMLWQRRSRFSRSFFYALCRGRSPRNVPGTGKGRGRCNLKHQPVGWGDTRDGRPQPPGQITKSLDAQSAGCPGVPMAGIEMCCSCKGLTVWQCNKLGKDWRG